MAFPVVVKTVCKGWRVGDVCVMNRHSSLVTCHSVFVTDDDDEQRPE